MIRVKKVYNNNVLLGEDDQQLECVLIGKGIGFGKKLDEKVDEEQAEKKFILESAETAKKFNQLLHEVPVRHLELTNQIVSQAQKQLNVKFNDSIYLGLTDHISYALDRHSQGITMRNALLWQVKQFYNREYEVACKSIELIQISEGVELPEDEASFIALHFVNAQQEGEEMQRTLFVTETVQDILRIVQLHYKIVLNEKSLNYSRFVTHIQYFIRRIFQRELVIGEDDEVYHQIKRKYPKAFQCTCKIKSYLEQKFNIEITSDEMLYFILHINRVAERTTKS